VRETLVKVVFNAAAIWIATLVVPGVEVSGDGLGRTVLTLILVGAIFGLVNTVIKPVVRFFSFPLYILTLGLFAFVVNALMLQIVSWVSDRIGISFHIDDFFWSALGAAVVVTFVGWVLNIVMPDPQPRRKVDGSESRELRD
jgi:putative membrane protein